MMSPHNPSSSPPSSLSSSLSACFGNGATFGAPRLREGFGTVGKSIMDTCRIGLINSTVFKSKLTLLR